MNILKTKIFFTYLVVGALITALSISCKSKTIPESASDLSVPNATGTEANDLENKHYFGPLTRGAYQIIGFSESEVQELMPENEEFDLNILGNKIVEGIKYEALEETQILKSGDEYSASEEVYRLGNNIKEYIRFTISADGSSLEVLEYVGVVKQGEKAFKVTYTGTLSYTSTIE